MKKIALFASALFCASLTLFSSCNTSSLLSSLSGGQSKPTLSFEKVSIKTLDMEGITFGCNYSVKNPYSVGISLASVAADISCNDSKLTSINASDGISIAAKKSKSNQFDFKVPYDSILNFAKTYKESKTLPFTVKGNVSLDKLPVISTLSLPFTKNFDVPVFKPSFKLSSPKLILPSATVIAAALVKGGKTNAIKAASLAKSLITGGTVEDTSLLDGLDLDMKLKFDMNVANEGGSDWKYALSSCGIKTDGQSDLISLDTDGSTEIESSAGTIPLTAKLNTLTSGKFIAQLLNKSGKNPSFSLESALSFPSLSYAPNLPLSYSKELPLSSVSRSSE